MAARVTQVTLIAAHSLADRLQDPGRMRAWVLALGRWAGHSRAAWGGSTLPSGKTGKLGEALIFLDTADDDVAEQGAADLEVSRGDAARDDWGWIKLDSLPPADREILDLFYRHDVSLADLPAVLGIPPGNAPGMLAEATAKFETSTLPGPIRVSRLPALPLVSLPASVWRRTSRVVIDPKFRSYREAVSAHAEDLGPDGFPEQTEVARGSTPAQRESQAKAQAQARADREARENEAREELLAEMKSRRPNSPAAASPEEDEPNRPI